jgi:hypothetical protein
MSDFGPETAEKSATLFGILTRGVRRGVGVWAIATKATLPLNLIERRVVQTTLRGPRACGELFYVPSKSRRSPREKCATCSPTVSSNSRTLIGRLSPGIDSLGFEHGG